MIDPESTLSEADCLGEITPHDTSDSNILTGTRPVQTSDCLCYTVNISPSDKPFGASAPWGALTPDAQFKFLRRVHHFVYVKMSKFMRDGCLDGCYQGFNNGCAFEFTKRMELHSHGYYVVQSKYAGITRTKAMLQKLLQAWLPRHKAVCYVRFAEDPNIWLTYISKDLATSGYDIYHSAAPPPPPPSHWDRILSVIEKPCNASSTTSGRTAPDRVASPDSLRDDCSAIAGKQTRERSGDDYSVRPDDPFFYTTTQAL